MLGLLSLRGRIRASELWLVVIATALGAVAGLAALTVSQGARRLQILLYGLDLNTRLSAISHLDPGLLAILPIGGLVVGLMSWQWARRRPNPIVDPVEANALRGGHMSARDSLFVGFQSLVSNGVGASVGLEAAYAQLGAYAASLAGATLNLRRSDLRTFVGAGAGAGIAAAFGAPLTGAFYAIRDHHRLLHRRQYRAGGRSGAGRGAGHARSAHRPDRAARDGDRHPDDQPLPAVRRSRPDLRALRRRDDARGRLERTARQAHAGTDLAAAGHRGGGAGGDRLEAA